MTKVSAIIAELQQLMEKNGDIDFGVFVPPIGLVGFATGEMKDSETHKTIAITIQPMPDVNQMVSSLLDGGNLPDEESPCKTCDMTDCPKHPSKLN
ncbi:hypothetical protein KAR91_47925 [Candidatus Pacearchaeota archaeon]|nr:hypothetical protein [Candidatus Pacearchaeota archaeon]